MRFLAIGLTAALLALPVAASAYGSDAHSAKAATVDHAAKKKVVKHHVRKKKEKVEYMRAAPMPPGAK
jgi:hypothetical protein